MSDHHGHSHHDHSHDHSHSHDHHDHHSGVPMERAFVIGIFLNLTYVGVELAYGFISDSLALVADAGHNFSDVVGLLLSWIAILLAKRKPDHKFTYGLQRSSILASLANAVILLIAVGMILWESIVKFIHPTEVQTTNMMIVATIGIIINTGTALLFMKGRHHDINVKGAFLHMAADAGLSAGVVLAGLGIKLTGWMWLDPLMGVIISLVIVWGTWSLLSESVKLAVDAVPEKIDSAQVRTYLESLDGVAEIHDLHIWGMSTTDTALTVHLVMTGHDRYDHLLSQVSEELKIKFGIEHSTIQCEYKAGHFVCDLKP